MNNILIEIEKHFKNENYISTKEIIKILTKYYNYPYKILEKLIKEKYIERLIAEGFDISFKTLKFERFSKIKKLQKN